MLQLGYFALATNTESSHNVAIGVEALCGITTAGNLTAVGYRALKENGATGYQNTAVGYLSLSCNTTGDF